MIMLLKNDRISLATYREIAAHLEQLPGIQITLYPQSAKIFDYLQSQIGSLQIDLPTPDLKPQVDRILAYYGKRYGEWQTLA